MDHPPPKLPKRFAGSEVFYGPRGGSPFRPRELTQMYGLLMLLGLLVVFTLLFWERGAGTLDRVFRSAASAPASQSTESGPATQPTDALRARIEADRQLEEQRRERRLLIPTLYQGAFADAGNGEDFKETPGYRELIRVLKDHAPSSALGRAESLMDYEEVLKDPDRFRGDVVRFRGVLLELVAHKLTTPVWGLTDVYRGYVAEKEGAECIVFDCPDRPNQKLEPRRDVVEVEGIFYRTVRYEARDGRLKEIPYILAKTVTLLDFSKSPTVSPFGSAGRQILLVLALALVVGGMIGYRFRRPARRAPPAPAGFREMFERKFEEERRNAHKPPPPPT